MKRKSCFKFTLLTLFAISCGGGGGDNGCNIAAGVVCPTGQYCAYLDNTCGSTGEEGTCMPIPEACSANVSPVCTCDSLTFGNECLANQSGQSIQAAGECA